MDRSGKDLEKCRVRFVNTTARTVNLVWLDEAGKRETRETLFPQTATSVLTFRGHPWIFVDADNGERLAVKTGDARSGDRTAFFEYDRHVAALRQSGECGEERARQLEEGRTFMPVLIEQFLDPLSTIALKTIRTVLTKKEDCFCLDVPQKVQFELAQSFP